jgi:hypothetical protein
MPVVVPQTVAELPNPQPVPPESIAARPPVEYKPAVKEAEAEEAVPDPKSTRQPAKPTRPPRRAPVEVPEVVTPPAVPAEEPAAAAPKLSAAGQGSVSREQVNGTLAEVQRFLKEIESRPQSAASGATIARIHSFVRLAEQSASRNDLRQGEIMAQRALALARDLAEPK